MIARLFARLHREHPMWARVSQACVLCHQASREMICPVCRNDLPRFDLSRCQGNLLHLPAVSLQLPDIPFGRALAMAPYVWPFDHWISQLKFSHRQPYTRALADTFVNVCREYVEQRPQCIWPTPLHPERLLTRQFNQAYQLAQSIGCALGIEVSEGPLRRVRPTVAQTSLGGAARRQNVKSAFQAEDVPDLEHIVLFDDVMTTGATLAAQYKILKQKRPRMRIDIWSLCVSLPNASLTACVDKSRHENSVAE